MQEQIQKVEQDEWSHVRETVLMLGLAIAQIESAMCDGEDSVSVLAESFTRTHKNVQTVFKVIEKSVETGDVTELARVRDHCKQITSQMSSVVMAMQFYDKLSQRLSHVTGGIRDLADLLKDAPRIQNFAEWIRLQEQIRSRYTLSEERQMFDVLLNTQDIDAALKKYKEARARKSRSEQEENIELFIT